MKLYKVENEIGTYWTIAEHPTEADTKVRSMLDKHDYGFDDKRKTKTITVIAESIDNGFLTGKFLVL